MRWFRIVRLSLLGLAVLAAPAASQDAEQEYESFLDWHPGTGEAVPVGVDLAEIDLPEGFAYLDAAGSQEFMELLENPPTGTEQATIAPMDEDAQWYLVFEWDDIGYVADDEQTELDADALMDVLQEGSKQGNRERRKRGWSELTLVGWARAPFYDPDTHNLTWATDLESEGERVYNHAIRVLGRSGVMSATLVTTPDAYDEAVADADALMAGFHFVPGKTYAEYVPGHDRAAKIGLTALITGGAAVAAVKTGLLARFWKVIVAGFVAFSAFVRRLFGGGRRARSV